MLQIWPLSSSFQHHHCSHFTGRRWTNLNTHSQLGSGGAKTKRIDLANHLSHWADDATMHPDTQAGNCRMYLPPTPFLRSLTISTTLVRSPVWLLRPLPYSPPSQHPCLAPGACRLFVCLFYFVFTNLQFTSYKICHRQVHWSVAFSNSQWCAPTTSTEFPVLASRKEGQDPFVSPFSPSLQSLIYLLSLWFSILDASYKWNLQQVTKCFGGFMYVVA